ncbi:unnamed protein product [Ophioblennius macclurei]
MEIPLENEGDEDIAECPVCYGRFTGNEVTLDCGHSFCLDCLLNIVASDSSGDNKDKVLCPMCRQLTVTKFLPRRLNDTPINATPSENGLFTISDRVQAESVRDVRVDMDNDFECCMTLCRYFTEELLWAICLFAIVYLVLFGVLLILA